MDRTKKEGKKIQLINIKEIENHRNEFGITGTWKCMVASNVLHKQMKMLKSSDDIFIYELSSLVRELLKLNISAKDIETVLLKHNHTAERIAEALLKNDYAKLDGTWFQPVRVISKKERTILG